MKGVKSTPVNSIVPSVGVMRLKSIFLSLFFFFLKEERKSNGLFVFVRSLLNYNHVPTQSKIAGKSNNIIYI